MYDIIGRTIVTLVLLGLIVTGPFAIGYAHAKEPSLSGVLVFLSLLAPAIVVLSATVLSVLGID